MANYTFSLKSGVTINKEGVHNQKISLAQQIEDSKKKKETIDKAVQTTKLRMDQKLQNVMALLEAITKALKMLGVNVTIGDYDFAKIFTAAENISEDLSTIIQAHQNITEKIPEVETPEFDHTKHTFVEYIDGSYNATVRLWNDLPVYHEQYLQMTDKIRLSMVDLNATFDIIKNLDSGLAKKIEDAVTDITDQIDKVVEGINTLKTFSQAVQISSLTFTSAMTPYGEAIGKICATGESYLSQVSALLETITDYLDSVIGKCNNYRDISYDLLFKMSQLLQTVKLVN